MPFCSAARELDTVMTGGVISPIELFLVCALRLARRWSVRQIAGNRRVSGTGQAVRLLSGPSCPAPLTENNLL